MQELVQVIFTSPEGRTEALWSEAMNDGSFRVLSVPVWAYGVSRGSLVAAIPDGRGMYVQSALLKDSPSATIRCLCREGSGAGETYRGRIIPLAQQAGIAIGPATFFEPRAIAITLRDRAQWWPEFGSLLDGLVQKNVIDGWEIADPYEYPIEPPEVLEPRPTMLVHPLPVDNQSDQPLN